MDSYNFLIKELEKVDNKILEPLTGTAWPRDCSSWPCPR